MCSTTAYVGRSRCPRVPFAARRTRSKADAEFTAARGARGGRLPDGRLDMERGAHADVFWRLLGGGAFGNRVEWIVDAVNAALETFKDAPLDVKLVHHGSVVKSQYKNGIKEKKKRKKPE